MIETDENEKREARKNDTSTRGDPVDRLAGQMIGYTFRPRLYGKLHSNLTVETDFLDRYVPLPLRASVYDLYTKAKAAARLAARIADRAFCSDRGRK